MGHFRDERIDYPGWADDFESYRRFYNVPKWSNYPLDDSNPLVLPRLELARLFARGRVLDVGCNGGKFDFALARAGLTVLGVDISENYVVVSQHLVRQEPPEVRSRLSFQVLAAEQLEFEAEFDTVMIMEVLEHVLDPVDVMRRCHRALKPDGIGLVTVPIAGGYWEKRQGAENDHLRAFTRENFQALLADAAERTVVWSAPRHYLFGLFFGAEHQAAVQKILAIDRESVLRETVMRRYHLIDCLEALGEHRLCQDLITTCVRREPNVPPNRLRLALHLHRTGKAQLAREILLPLARDPVCRTYSYFLLLAEVLAACGRKDEAAEALATASQLPREAEKDWISTLWEI